MSHVYYTELWLATRNDLGKLLELEEKLQARPLRNEERFLNEVLSMYIRYMLGLIKNITKCKEHFLIKYSDFVQ